MSSLLLDRRLFGVDPKLNTDCAELLRAFINVDLHVEYGRDAGMSLIADRTGLKELDNDDAR